MENVLKKSLNKREKSFEKSSCPLWLLNILPTPFKTIEIINENENDQQQQQQQQQQIFDDLKPYELITRIPLLNKTENESINNSLQLIYLSSNEQIINLLKKFREYKQIHRKKSSEKRQNIYQCQENVCTNKAIPLSSFCKNHFIENDSKQILFEKCSFCQQIHIKFDQKNLFNFCSH